MNASHPPPWLSASTIDGIILHAPAGYSPSTHSKQIKEWKKQGKAVLLGGAVKDIDAALAAGVDLVESCGVMFEGVKGVAFR